MKFFSGKFGEIWAKILRTPKNVPAPTPMIATSNYLQISLSGMLVVETSLTYHSFINTSASGSSRRLSSSVLSAILF